MKVHSLNLPLTEQEISSLKIGDKVLLSGILFTARDAAHRRLYSMLSEGTNIPFELNNAAIFYCGPSPTPPGRVCGAIGPTTSARMDRYSPLLIERGMKVMIGKGERSEVVQACIHDHRAVYLTCLGGVSALLSEAIVSCETFLWEELGTEAVFKLVVLDLPCYVAYL